MCTFTGLKNNTYSSSYFTKTSSSNGVYIGIPRYENNVVVGLENDWMLENVAQIELF